MRLAIIFLMLMLAATTSAYRILCLLPYPGKSHDMVFKPLLQELTRRGHHLTVVSFFPEDDPGPWRRDVSLIGLSPIYVEVVDLKAFEFSLFGLERYLEHAPLVMNLARSNLELCEKLFDWPAFQEFISGEGTYDLIIVEQFNSDCMMGVIHKYDVPFVGLMSSAILPWTAERHGFPDNPAYVPGMTLRLTDQMSFLERFENAFFLYFYKMWFRWEIRPKEQAIIERKLGKLPPLEDIAKNASVVLINTHHSLNGVKALVPAIVEVGGLHLHGRTVQKLPQQLENFMSAAEEGVILLSFGSLIRSSTMPRHRLEQFLKALARLPQRVIWKWETDDIQGLPSNVLIMKWVPQYDILHHPNCLAFISHGGLLSMTEAVEAGVPMVVIPILGDQFGNAAHAHQAGLATILHYSSMDEESLHSAIVEVLQPQARARAQRLSQVWRDRPAAPLHTAAYWVERTARLARTAQLAGASRNMPAYQTALLDVFTLAVLIVLLTLALFYYVASNVLYFLGRHKVKVSYGSFYLNLSEFPLKFVELH